MRSIQEDMTERRRQLERSSIQKAYGAVLSYMIVECDLVSDFDPGDPDTLAARIETATAAFVGDMERFLAQHQPPN